MREHPPDESDDARHTSVLAALGTLDEPHEVLALWDALVDALADVLRQRHSHHGYRGTGRLRGHELSDLTLAMEHVLEAACALRFERATLRRAAGVGASRRTVDEEARGSVWRTRLLLGGAAASAVAFGTLLTVDLTSWLPLAFAGATLLPAVEMTARVIDKLPKKRGDAMRRHREEQWLRPDEVRRFLEERRDDALEAALGTERDVGEGIVADVHARVSTRPPRVRVDAPPGVEGRPPDDRDATRPDDHPADVSAEEERETPSREARSS
ncbi:MAG: hypothetical protein R3B99_14025 [Polyangiales bacterium]